MNLPEMVAVFGGAGGLAWVIAAAGNSWALRPWRAAREAHWTERARLLYPARAAAASTTFSIPASVALAAGLAWPALPWLAFGAAMAAWVGATAASIRLSREALPWLVTGRTLRHDIVGRGLRAARWFVFLAAVIAMPRTLDARAGLLGGTVVLLHAVWVSGGMVVAARILGLYRPAPERLRVMAAEVAGRMGVPVRRVWLNLEPAVSPLALPIPGDLVFPAGMLERQTDAEIKAVCAHELAHLTENPVARGVRFVGSLAFAPWLWLKPLLATHEMGGLAAVIIFSLVLVIGVQRMARRLEIRADRIAADNQPTDGTYARALALLHEGHLVPAVFAARTQIHPNLYDRMTAAGVTPGFPRPAPPGKMALHGRLFQALLSLLAGVALGLWLR